MYGHHDEKNKNNSLFFGYHEESQDPQVYKNALAGMGKASNDLKTDGVNPSQSVIAKVQQDNLKVIFLTIAMRGSRLYTGAAAIILLRRRTFWNDSGAKWGDQLAVTSYRIEYNIP